MALDVTVTVADAVRAGYEFAVADADDLGVRAPGGDFRKGVADGRGRRVIDENIDGRLLGFEAEDSALADVVLAPSAVG